jgi:hypothetical protein
MIVGERGDKYNNGSGIHEFWEFRGQHLKIEYYQSIYLLIFNLQNEERFFLLSCTSLIVHWILTALIWVTLDTPYFVV